MNGASRRGRGLPGAPTGVTGVGVPGPRLCVYPPEEFRPRGGQNAHAPKMSHVISLGQFSICPENVGIATTRFQSLKDVSGNYVRHLWGTMRVRVLQGLAGLSTQAMPRLGARPRPYSCDCFSRASNQAVKRRIAASARSSISAIGLGFARTPPRHRPRIHQPPKLPPTLPPPLRGIPTPPTPLNAKSR